MATHALTEDGPKRLARDVLGRTQALWASYWRAPTDRTRNLLVEEYQGLVQRVVGAFSARLPKFVDRDDLVTAGNVGLMAAIASFDPARRTRFQNYAETRIRGAILDELRAQDWLPRPWRQRIQERKRCVEELRSELGREPLDEEVADALGMTLEDFEALFGVGLPGGAGGSSEVPFEDAAARLEVVVDSRHAPPGEGLTRSELLRLVSQRLSELEARVVYLRYWEELSMREIGEVMGLSESRVYKIHMRLIERLQMRFGEAGGS